MNRLLNTLSERIRYGKRMTAADHYPHIDQLTPYQKEKIAELRKKTAEELASYPEYDTDFSLLRWLMGWDYEVDVIVPKLKNALSVLKNLHLDEEELKSPEGINAHIRSMSAAADYFPGGIMCTDNEGNVVYMQTIARTHPKSLAKAGPVSELFRLSVVEADLAIKLVRQNEKETGKKLGVKLVIDLDEFSMDLLYTPTLKIYKELLTLLQTLFPDFARKIYVINTPLMIKTAYMMISPVLSKQTREKVTFLGDDWRQILANDLGTTNIYRHWGGSKEHHLSVGDLRVGGKVPEKQWYIAQNNPDEEGLKKFNVGARSKQEVTIEVPKGKTLHWFWKVNSGDLDFSIERQGKAAFPKLRLSTEFHPEIAKMECREGGTYTLVFDNSHGMMWSKDVEYKTRIE